MSAAALLWRQIRHANRVFWREPLAAFFTMAFPLMFLLLFGFIFGDTSWVSGLTFIQFFTPAIAVFAAATATFTNLAIGMSISRDEGILKRARSTPIPPWIYMSGRILSSVWTAFVAIVIMFTLSWILFDFVVVWGNVPIALLVFAVGTATMSALGLAVCAMVKTGTSAPAVANAIILPMAFLSGIFISPEDTPSWLLVIGDVLPLKHFAALFGRAFTPAEAANLLEQGPILGWDRIAVMAGWCLLCLFLSLRFFRWEPRGAK